MKREQVGKGGWRRRRAIRQWPERPLPDSQNRPTAQGFDICRSLRRLGVDKQKETLAVNRRAWFSYGPPRELAEILSRFPDTLGYRRQAVLVQERRQAAILHWSTGE